MTQLRQLSLTHYTVCIIFFVDSFFSQVRALLASGRSCDLNSLCSKMDWILNRTTSSFRPLPSSMNSRTSFTSPTVGTRRPSPSFRPTTTRAFFSSTRKDAELGTPNSWKHLEVHAADQRSHCRSHPGRGTPRFRAEPGRVDRVGPSTEEDAARPRESGETEVRESWRWLD